MWVQFFHALGNGSNCDTGPVVSWHYHGSGGSVGSNIGKGLFLALPFSALLFNRMFLGGGISILAQGIVGEHSGHWLLWSQWFLAYCPLIVPTIFSSWLLLRWLYPPEPLTSPVEVTQTTEAVPPINSWGWDAKKTLGWLILAMVLWMTDFLYHINPAMIGLGIALLMTAPKIGVLDAQDVKAINFSLVLFVGGTLSMATVLTSTQALDLVADAILHWGEMLFSNGIIASQALYWGGFLYHFVAGGEHTMISSLLPVLLQISESQNYSPVFVGLVWDYSVSSYLFVYQSPVLVLAYSFGHFTIKDLIKVGFLFTLIQSILLILLVHFYWPLIGIIWSATHHRNQMSIVRLYASMDARLSKFATASKINR
ncbi:hypothetical protein C2W62_40335 [Candidatus Entotheonella serta]|nr:hypothetical protein C2W62_40335 [Candidatus Entotheonella serta]